MKHAEVQNDVIVTVRSAPYPAINPITIEVPDEVECGWRRVNGQWQPARREILRQELRELWAGLPSWIQGPYGAHFTTASRHLDAHQDQLALDLVQYLPALSTYDEAEAATFGIQRLALAAKIREIVDLEVTEP